MSQKLLNSVKFQDTKINMQKALVLLHTNTELSEKTNPIFSNFKNTKILKKKFNQGNERYIY